MLGNGEFGLSKLANHPGSTRPGRSASNHDSLIAIPITIPLMMAISVPKRIHVGRGQLIVCGSYAPAYSETAKQIGLAGHDQHAVS